MTFKAQAQVAKWGLKFSLSLHLYPDFVCASSDDFSETALIGRLVWAFTTDWTDAICSNISLLDFISLRAYKTFLHAQLSWA